MTVKLVRYSFYYFLERIITAARIMQMPLRDGAERWLWSDPIIFTASATEARKQWNLVSADSVRLGADGW